MKVLPVEPIGTNRSPAFVDWYDEKSGTMKGEFREVDMPAYPLSPCGEAMRHLRVLAGLSLRDAAKMFGISAVDLSSLERGSAKLSDEEWIAAFQMIRTNARGDAP